MEGDNPFRAVDGILQQDISMEYLNFYAKSKKSMEQILISIFFSFKFLFYKQYNFHYWYVRLISKTGIVKNSTSKWNVYLIPKGLEDLNFWTMS